MLTFITYFHSKVCLDVQGQITKNYFAVQVARPCVVETTVMSPTQHYFKRNIGYFSCGKYFIYFILHFFPLMSSVPYVICF